jgi:hypothetical protein
MVDQNLSALMASDWQDQAELNISDMVIIFKLQNSMKQGLHVAT